MIAISYRRDDSLPIAGRLYDRLEAEFGKANVFMDFDSIPYGVNFRDHIRKTIERANLVIAIIGPNWSGERAGTNARVADPGDFVRLEIAYALELAVPVIPVLVNHALMPLVNQLPEDLHAIVDLNALTLDTGADFHHHAGRLIASIRHLKRETGARREPNRESNAATDSKHQVLEVISTKEKIHGDSRSDARPRHTRRMILIGGLGCFAVFTLFVWYFFGQSETPQVEKTVSPVASKNIVPARSDTTSPPSETIAPLPLVTATIPAADVSVPSTTRSTTQGVVRSAGPGNNRTFRLASPDGHFEAVCDWDAVPIFKIVDQSTAKTMLVMDDEQTGNRGLSAAWSPDSKTLAIIVTWRLYDQLFVCRLTGDRFDRTEGPKAPENQVKILAWSGSDDLKIVGANKIYSLRIGPSSVETKDIPGGPEVQSSSTTAPLSQDLLRKVSMSGTWRGVVTYLHATQRIPHTVIVSVNQKRVTMTWEGKLNGNPVTASVSRRENVLRWKFPMHVENKSGKWTEIWTCECALHLVDKAHVEFTLVSTWSKGPYVGKPLYGSATMERQ